MKRTRQDLQERGRLPPLPSPPLPAPSTVPGDSQPQPQPRVSMAGCVIRGCINRVPLVVVMREDKQTRQLSTAGDHSHHILCADRNQGKADTWMSQCKGIHIMCTCILWDMHFVVSKFLYTLVNAFKCTKIINLKDCNAELFYKIVQV